MIKIWTAVKREVTATTAVSSRQNQQQISPQSGQHVYLT